MNEVMHCWPTPWLEAAMRAGFAHYKGPGEWAFISDAMRDKLAEFATEIQAAERERCANTAESWPVAATDRPASIGVRIAAAIRAQP